MEAQDNDAPQESEDKPNKIHFFKLGGYWYFDNKSGKPIGPFNEVYETTLSEWRTTERTLCGDKMKNLLAPYLNALPA